MTPFMSLEEGESTGLLWQVTGANGDAAGARNSMINGTTACTGDTHAMCFATDVGRDTKFRKISKGHQEAY